LPRKTTKAEKPAVTTAEASGAEEMAVRPSEGTADASDLLCPAQAVTFRLNGQLYGLPLDVVQEIQQLAEFTPVPDDAPALLGLIDVRGVVVPAIDLRVLVGLEPRPFTLETPMVFCRVRGHVVCLVVDAVEDVIDLPEGGLQAPSGLYGLADRMLGMCRIPEGLVLLLDIDRLVPDAALAAADASAGGR